MLHSVIIGLGQVGYEFDNMPVRIKAGEIGWTHYYAYKSLRKIFRIVAVVDKDKVKLSKFLLKNPDILGFTNVNDLIESGLKFDVVSICLPDNKHISCLERIIPFVKGIFLEKPICELKSDLNLETIKNLIVKNNISIRVNYYKTKEYLYKKIFEIINRDDVKYSSLKYSAPLYAVGSHALSVIFDINSSLRLYNSLKYDSHEGTGYTCIFSDEKNKFAEIVYCGTRKNLMFELEVLTSQYKINLIDNFTNLIIQKYSASKRYDKYNELKLHKKLHKKDNRNRFNVFLNEISEEIKMNKICYNNFDHSTKIQYTLNDLLKNCNE